MTNQAIRVSQYSMPLICSSWVIVVRICKYVTPFCTNLLEKACMIFHRKVSCGLKTFPIKDIGIDFLLDGKIANIV